MWVVIKLAKKFTKYRVYKYFDYSFLESIKITWSWTQILNIKFNYKRKKEKDFDPPFHMNCRCIAIPIQEVAK
jgi:hypothetical protein